MSGWTVEIVGHDIATGLPVTQASHMDVYLESFRPDGSPFTEERFGDETLTMKAKVGDLAVRVGPEGNLVALLPRVARPKTFTVVPDVWESAYRVPDSSWGMEALPDTVLASIPGKRVHEVVGGGPFQPGTKAGDAIIADLSFTDLWGTAWHPVRHLRCRGIVLRTETCLFDRRRQSFDFAPSNHACQLWERRRYPG